MGYKAHMGELNLYVSSTKLVLNTKLNKHKFNRYKKFIKGQIIGQRTKKLSFHKWANLYWPTEDTRQ